MIRRWQLRRRAARIGLDALPPAEQLRLARQLGFYDDLLRILERRQIERPAHLTPLEFAKSLLHLPAGAYRSVRRLTEVFYRVRYGQQAAACDRATGPRDGPGDVTTCSVASTLTPPRKLMNAIILSVGDELVLGQTVDTNSAWLSQQLAAIGCDIIGHRTVGDDQDMIEMAIGEAAEMADVILLSGGLGPTEDDLTRQAIASLMNVELVVDES